MGMLGTKQIACPAGVWTTIITTSLTSFPKAWTVRFDGEIEGECEVKKSAWIFPGTPNTLALAARMTFDRGYWNTFFLVRVRPRAAIVAVIE